MHASIGPAVSLLLLIAAVVGKSQTAPYDDPRNLPYSPEVHADRRITFRFFAPNAKDVVLMGPTMVAAVDGPKHLVKDDKGVWNITVGPLPPAIYSYGFSIDGAMRVPDPANPWVETRRWGHGSYVEVPADTPTPRDYRPVPHGTLHSHFYDSKAIKMPREFVVYTPPGYEKSTQLYPVLYLLHGSTQVSESWSRVGGAQIILDNLIADGKAKPMIIVMPYGHIPFQMTPAETTGRGGAGRGNSNAPDDFERDLLGDVMPLVQETYRLLPGRDARAIAGLSMGGGQAITVGLHNLDKFAYLATFSGVVNYRPILESMDPATLNKNLKMFWLGCGTEDSLYTSEKTMADWLEEHKVNHTWMSVPGAHVWPVWHRFLAEIAPKLFQK